MKATALLLLVATLSGCSSEQPAYYTFTQNLAPKATMTIRTTGTIDAYKPAIGEAPTLLTLQPTGSAGVAVLGAILTRSGTTFTYNVDYARSLLARIPDGVALDVASTKGDVNVTDITGPTVAYGANGTVKVMVPGYAQASSGVGNVTVYMGATSWPGTLKFGAHAGDVEVWINATAQFNVRMHTDHGTIFTDFGLTGTSSGESETIVGTVGGKATQGIDIEVVNGSIRLLQLKPQV
ncbi:MAG: DUF4097 domain-containing protein [Candidatus Eremiobacteraeota bacterium]|nr:DUF4097 domain-containing protein [Candidatus Eremiobacteraeota bacterium]